MTRAAAIPIEPAAPAGAGHVEPDLLAELAAGSDTALGHLIQRWGPPLQRFVHRYVDNTAAADDLVQETFVRLYQNRDRYRPGRSPAAWIFTIAANLCHNHRRWAGRHATVPLASPSGEDHPSAQPVSPTHSPAERLLQAETTAAVRAAIDALPHDLKVALLLFEFDDMSYADIGRVVGCSARGVETRLLRARARLRALLGGLWRDLNPERGVSSGVASPQSGFRPIGSG